MDISDWRSRINEIDDTLIEALNKRAEYVLRIGEIKHKKGLQIKDPEREKELLKRINARNRGPLSGDAIREIFNAILRESCNLQTNQSLTKNIKTAVCNRCSDSGQ